MFSATPINKRQNMNRAPEAGVPGDRPSQPIQRRTPDDLSVEAPDPNAVAIFQSSAAAVSETLRYAILRTRQQSPQTPTDNLSAQSAEQPPVTASEPPSPPLPPPPPPPQDSDSDSDLEPPPELQSLKQTQAPNNTLQLRRTSNTSFDLFDTSFVSPLKQSVLERIISTPVRTVPYFPRNLGPPQRTPTKIEPPDCELLYFFILLFFSNVIFSFGNEAG